MFKLTLRNLSAHKRRLIGTSLAVCLGVAFLAGSVETVRWYTGHLGKGAIGPDKVNQLRHSQFFGSPQGVRDHMQKHRQIIAPKFESVLGVLHEQLDGLGIASWTEPTGGYFISLDVMDGCAKELVRLSKEAGVELTPAGSTHPLGKDPRDRNVRIAPTFPDLATVTTAAEGVALSVLLATSTALLAKAGTPAG